MWPSFIRSRSPRHRMAKRSAESVRARPDHRRVSNGDQDNAQRYKREASQSEGNPPSPLWSFVGNVSRSGEILHTRFITRIQSVLKLAVLLAQTINTDCREQPGAYDKNRRKPPCSHSSWFIATTIIFPSERTSFRLRNIVGFTNACLRPAPLKLLTS